MGVSISSDSFERHRKEAPSGPDVDTLRSLLDQMRHPEAAMLAQSLTERYPGFGFGWKALGRSLKGMGRHTAALAAMQKAAALAPTETEVHFELGLALYRLGRFAEAEACFRRVLQIRPEYVDAHNNLANILQVQGRLAESEVSFRRALQLRPQDAEIHSNLGTVLQAQGRPAESEASFRWALQIAPEVGEFHSNLGHVLQAQGRLAESEASYRRALQLRPDRVEPHHNLGTILEAQGKLNESADSYRRAVQIRPDYVVAWNNLGNVLLTQGRLAESETSYRQALQFNADVGDFHNNLGCVLLACGRLEESEASFRRALQIRPQHAEAHSNLLLSLNYLAGRTEEEVLSAHREYEARFGGPHQGRSPSPKDRGEKTAAERRLRIGYVSPDFRQHSVAAFFAPLLREHDRQCVEVFCYADVAQPDAVTAQLQALADHWVGTAGLPHAALAQMIATDGIDILVDLAGHTAGNRLPVFARRAAAIQITWLGYPNTTGLSAMDYRLVDAVTDPPGHADRWATETLIRLDDGFLCFEPPVHGSHPVALAGRPDGAITFGSFNNPAKLSPETLDAWVALLGRVSGSRLLLKGTGFADEAVREAFLSRFAQRGGDPQRVTLLGYVDGLAEHLALYEQIDVALDPFPYNGTTTTCEALWMGVPVVTLAGNRHAARVGASLLTRIGLPELIARTVEEYVGLAAALAADHRRRSTMRHSLRERVRTSPLCDARGFARSMEATYRDLWQRHCRADN